MVIKGPYVIPLIRAAYPVNPLHEEEPSLPLAVKVEHVKYQSQGSPMTHKIVETLGLRDLLGFCKNGKNSSKVRDRWPPLS